MKSIYCIPIAIIILNFITSYKIIYLNKLNSYNELNENKNENSYRSISSSDILTKLNYRNSHLQDNEHSFNNEPPKKNEINSQIKSGIAFHGIDDP